MCHAPVKQTPPSQTAAAGDAQESPRQEAPPDESSSGEEEEEDEEFPGEETEEEEEEEAKEEEKEEEQGPLGDAVQTEKGGGENNMGCSGDAGTNTESSEPPTELCDPTPEPHLSPEVPAHTDKHAQPPTPEPVKEDSLSASPLSQDSGDLRCPDNGLPHHHSADH